MIESTADPLRALIDWALGVTAITDQVGANGVVGPRFTQGQGKPFHCISIRGGSTYDSIPPWQSVSITVESWGTSSSNARAIANVFRDNLLRVHNQVINAGESFAARIVDANQETLGADISDPQTEEPLVRSFFRVNII